MRISDIITNKLEEDASAGATGASGMASVAFPLFGDPDQIRKAVDPNGYLGKGKKKPKVIKRMMEKMDSSHTAAIPSMMDIGGNGKDLNDWGKAVAGHDGKKQTSPSKKATFGDHGYAVGYTKVERDMASKAIKKKTKHMSPAGSSEPKDTHKHSALHGDLREGEATNLHADDVIYRLDRDNPMDDSEILVIGGAGRYSFKGLRAKARKEADALAQDLQGDHGSDFRGSLHNIAQLKNTLRTIVAAYDQMNKIRAKGGANSRGIRNEDHRLIGECMDIAEQWVQKYKTR